MKELQLGEDGVLPILPELSGISRDKMVLLKLTSSRTHYYYILSKIRYGKYMFKSLTIDSIGWHEHFEQKTLQETCQFMLSSTEFALYQGQMILFDNLTEMCQYIAEGGQS